MTRRRHVAGFTLTELLIAIAILGLLAMVAYPSYQNSVLKTRRSDGIAAALAVQVAQEKFRASCQWYAQTISTANSCGASASVSTVQAESTSPEGYYTISIASGTASGNSYTISADPIGVQAEDTACDPMTITFSASFPNGEKGPDGCW